MRLVLSAWADEWRRAGRPGGLTVPELADTVPGMSGQSPADCRAVRDAVGNMLRVGELVGVGTVPSPHRCRPRGLYAPSAATDDGAGPAQSAVQASAQLAAALGGLWSAKSGRSGLA